MVNKKKKGKKEEDIRREEKRQRVVAEVLTALTTQARLNASTRIAWKS